MIQVMIITGCGKSFRARVYIDIFAIGRTKKIKEQWSKYVSPRYISVIDSKFYSSYYGIITFILRMINTSGFNFWFF